MSHQSVRLFSGQRKPTPKGGQWPRTIVNTKVAFIDSMLGKNNVSLFTFVSPGNIIYLVITLFLRPITQYEELACKKTCEMSLDGD